MTRAARCVAAAVSAVLLALFASATRAQKPLPAPEPTPVSFEMTTYYVALLYRGPKWTPETTPAVEKTQAGHMAHINEMAIAGKLVLAGPFSDDGKLRGMFVLQVDTMDEAKKLCDADPAVKAGRLAVEIHPWYSAKGIQVVVMPRP